jgi:hypothetical protein
MAAQPVPEGELFVELIAPDGGDVIPPRIEKRFV